MGRKCCVPNYKEGYKGAPKDPDVTFHLFNSEWESNASNIKQKSRLKRNNGIQRQYLNFRESFLTKIYIWHLSDVRFKKTH